MSGATSRRLPADQAGIRCYRHLCRFYTRAPDVASISYAPMRILVVEDDLDLGQVISEIFNRETTSVRVAHTRQGALDECLAFQPHMLVLDIGLPDGDGFNVVDWLRQHEDLGRMPLVVYSAHGLTQAERMQLVLGLTHFLAKASVEPEQLEALVLTMLRSSQEIEESLPEVSAS